MVIFYIDDEAALLASAERTLQQVRPNAEIKTFSRGQAALDAVTKDGIKPDVVFCDIRMPGISGLQLAVQLRTLCPTARIIFVTGYEEYALDAFRVHAHGYVLKPLSPERVAEELELVAQPPAPQPKKLVVQCFGYFEAFWEGKPLQFQRQQTKELLAYLINREGTACTSEQISAALWENESDLKTMKNRIRVLINDLRTTLRNIGMEDLIIRSSGWVAVNRELVDCDFYRMLDGDMDALNRFGGQFMQQYPWAELTAGRLYFNYYD